MIARRLRMNTVSKSSMIRLVTYLTDSQGHDQRVADVRITHCVSEDPQWAALEMTATQRMNSRAAGDKTYHLMLSFQEKPSLEVIHAIEDDVCAKLGFEGHQRLSVLHGDTDNLHLHVCINKIHPERLTIHEPYYDYKTLASLSVRLEQHYGLLPDNHIPRAEAVETAAKNMEKAGDMESLIGWIQRTCLADLKKAASWAEMHDTLTRHGLSVKERGNGLVFVADGVHVKASSVDRSLSRKRLEERLGPFEASLSGQRTPDAAQRGNQPEASATYRKQPMRHRGFDASELWKRFQEWRKEEDLRRNGRLKALRRDRDRELVTVEKMADARSMVIRHMVKGPIMKRMLHALSQARLRREKEAIRARYRNEVSRLNTRASWRTWLHDEAKDGNVEALAAMRARDQRERDVPSVTRQESPVKITHKGTLLFADGTRDSGFQERQRNAPIQHREFVKQQANRARGR